MRVLASLLGVGLLSTLAALAMAKFPAEQVLASSRNTLTTEQPLVSWDFSAFERPVRLEAITKRPPFSELRRPAVIAESGETASVSSAQDLDVPLDLIGVFAARKKRSALFRIGDAENRLWVSEGDSEAGITVVRVTAQGAEVLRGGRVDWLHLSARQSEEE